MTNLNIDYPLNITFIIHRCRQTIFNEIKGIWHVGWADKNMLDGEIELFLVTLKTMKI